MTRVWRIASFILIAIVFFTNVYRAVTQSMTIDEAFTYNLYLSKNLHVILTQFDANNHVLFTFLAKAAVKLFGKAEWIVRLPTVLAGLLYLVVAWKLCRLLFGAGWLFLLGLAALSLNPYLLDFLSAARGYGLAIALLMLAIYFLVLYLDSAGEQFLPRAGVALGLSVAANLNMIFPAAAIVLAAWFLAGTRIRTMVSKLGLPMLIVAFFILLVPLSHATRGQFYAGNDSISGAAVSLTALSVWHPRTTSEMDHYTTVPVAICIGWLAAILVIAVWRHSVQTRFLGLSFGINILLLIGAHYALGLKYPEYRTAVYFIPLFTLLILAFLKTLDKIPWLQVVCALPLLAVVALYIAEWNVSVYGEWPFDSSSRTVAKLLSERHPKRVYATGELVEALNYYHDRYRFSGFPSIDRFKTQGDFDLYVLLPSDYAKMQEKHLQPIFKDDRSEVVVAVPE
jgi:predicted membrane-bound mannosyltransferase